MSEETSYDALKKVKPCGISAEVVQEYLQNPETYMKTASVERFGVKYSELVELPIRFRNACVNYYHPGTNRIFTQSFLFYGWDEPTGRELEQLKRYIPKLNK
jgi:hypothetical protein